MSFLTGLYIDFSDASSYVTFIALTIILAMSIVPNFKDKIIKKLDEYSIYMTTYEILVCLFVMVIPIINIVIILIIFSVAGAIFVHLKLGPIADKLVNKIHRINKNNDHDLYDDHFDPRKDK